MSEEYYDHAAALQQEKVAQTKDMLKQRELMRRCLALTYGERVLDVGSGNGIFARDMLNDVGSSGRVVGIDPAASMVTMARALCPDARFLQGHAEALPVDDNEFDVVTASQVLCFVPDIDAALAEMFRVLKPGGRLVVLDSDWGSLIWNCHNTGLRDRIVAELTKPYQSAYVPRTLSRRLKAAGFCITKRKCHVILNWERNENSFSQLLLGFIPETSPDESGAIRKDKAEWETELANAEDSGEYMFSLTRFIFCAVKN